MVSEAECVWECCAAVRWKLLGVGVGVGGGGAIHVECCGLVARRLCCCCVRMNARAWGFGGWCTARRRHLLQPVLCGLRV